MSTQAQAIQQNVTFTTTLYNKAKWAATKEGISVPEFVRFAVIHYVKDLKDDYVELLDEETGREAVMALKDYKKGKYKEIPDEAFESAQKLHEFMMS